MTPSAQPSAIRPEAETQTVETLVAWAKEGRIRIPTFQRGLKWGTREVLELFDSIYRGYPIGSLLLRKAPAEAATFPLGPLWVQAEAMTDALAVIDGQQRLTTLAAALGRPNPVPTTPDDPFVVYFDVRARDFRAPPSRGGVPPDWVPVAQLLDAAALNEWVFTWKYGRDQALRSLVFEAGKRLREYPVPLYVVRLGQGDDDAVLGEIFRRTNTAGKKMTWPEVHDALLSKPDYKLADLNKALGKAGMGLLNERQLLLCLIAYEGLDPTHNLADHQKKNPKILQDTVREVLPTLQKVLAFLRTDAEIPHLRLLPRVLPLVILVRYFKLFPEPTPRARILLVRWTWRTLLSLGYVEERPLLRRGVTGLKKNLLTSEQAAQALLKLVPNQASEVLPYFVPATFNAKAAESRLLLLGLASLGPLDLLTHEPVDVAVLLEPPVDVVPTEEVEEAPLEVEEAPLLEAADSPASKKGLALRTIVAKNLSFSPANLLLLPGKGAARSELLQLTPAVAETVGATHGISRDALAALRQNDVEAFLTLREATLQAAVREMGDRLAAWGQSDRRSIEEELAAIFLGDQ